MRILCNIIAEYSERTTLNDEHSIYYLFYINRERQHVMVDDVHFYSHNSSKNVCNVYHELMT